jgi:hypothetical protein
VSLSPDPTAKVCPPPAWVRYVVRPTFHPRRAALLRLSGTAAGLLAPEPVAAGAVVLLQLGSPGTDRLRIRRARVASVEPLGREEHLLDCRFDPPLSAADLVAVCGQFAAAE